MNAPKSESGESQQVPKIVSTLLAGYYRAPDHPMKMRIWAWIRQGFPGRLVIPYAGGRLSIDERDLLQRRILGEGFYEPEIFDALLSGGSTDEVLWDIGANIGSFAVRAMLDRRVKCVRAFEPDPGNFAVLQANVAMNAGSARAFELAVSDTSEPRRLSIGPVANRGVSSFEQTAGRQTVDVSCTTIDEMVFERHETAPTLIKVDVEGWEFHVFRGAARLLSQQPPKAIVFEDEYVEGRSIDALDAVRFLKSFGYSVNHIARAGYPVEERENYLALR